MSGNNTEQLLLRLTPDEAEILRCAAEAAGRDRSQVSSWAKELLLKQARAVAPRTVQTGDEGFEILPAPPPPQCFCGETRAPHGECDGSCILRY